MLAWRSFGAEMLEKRNECGLELHSDKGILQHFKVRKIQIVTAADTPDRFESTYSYWVTG